MPKKKTLGDAQQLAEIRNGQCLSLEIVKDRILLIA